MKENWEKVTMITIDDKLEALSETERGALCSHTYQKLRAKGLDVDLATIMVTISSNNSLVPRDCSLFSEDCCLPRT